jgi:hypothetical protein
MAELSAQGPILAGGATSVAISTSVAPHTRGDRMRDRVGNEYVWVDFTSTVSAEQPVQINSDYTAGALDVTGRGAVGVAQGAGTSNESGWVQVYGRSLVQIGKSGVSPSDAANGPTTVQTVAGIIKFVLGTSATSPNGVGMVTGAAGLTSDADFIIEGMFVATDASPGDVSSVTSATSHTGNHVAVFLNYPFIRCLDAVSTS